jgi:hypothetical protein
VTEVGNEYYKIVSDCSVAKPSAPDLETAGGSASAYADAAGGAAAANDNKTVAEKPYFDACNISCNCNLAKAEEKTGSVDGVEEKKQDPDVCICCWLPCSEPKSTEVDAATPVPPPATAAAAADPGASWCNCFSVPEPKIEPFKPVMDSLVSSQSPEDFKKESDRKLANVALCLKQLQKLKDISTSLLPSTLGGKLTTAEVINADNAKQPSSLPLPYLLNNDDAPYVTQPVKLLIYIYMCMYNIYACMLFYFHSYIYFFLYYFVTHRFIRLA